MNFKKQIQDGRKLKNVGSACIMPTQQQIQDSVDKFTLNTPNISNILDMKTIITNEAKANLDSQV